MPAAMAYRAQAFIVVFCVLCCGYLPAPAAAASSPGDGDGDGFFRCLSAAMPSRLVFPRGSPSFAAALASSIRNPKFMAPGTARPLAVAAPAEATTQARRSASSATRSGGPPEARARPAHGRRVQAAPVSVDEGTVDAVTRWQTVAPALPDDLLIRVLVQGRVAEFQSLYHGACDALLPVMRRRFPELGVNRAHCREMTWLESVPYIYLGSGAAVEDIRDLHAFMAPHVSKGPREAYFNYRDLDLGENAVVGNVSSYEAGKVWGEKYFKGNFRRLAMAKAQIDPDDYFRNEQSIPPLIDTEQPVVIKE